MVNEKLNLIILPTEECNFRCKYCYENFTVKKMSEDTFNGIKNLLRVREKEISKLTISWFGGEPLLAYREIIDFLNFCNIEMKHPSAFEMKSNITTNGSLLLPKKLEELTSLGVDLYQVTLDGDKEFHDKLRVTKSGAGTYEMVINNLRKASELDIEFRFIIRLHINRENVESVKSLLGELSKFLEKDGRFVIYLRGLSRLGGKNDSGLPVASREFIADNVLKLDKLAKELGLNTNLEAFPKLGMQGFAGIPQCYAASVGSFVIRADGSIAKCTVAFNDPRNKIGHISSSGELKIEGDKFSWWTRGNLSGDKDQLTCPLRARS